MAESEVFARPASFSPATARMAHRSAIRAGKFEPGGIIEQSCGAAAPHRFADEVTLLRAIPASSCGGNPRRGRFLSAALPLSYGGFGHRWESNPRPSARRSNPRLHHAANSSVSFSLLRYLFTSPPGTPRASRSEVRITPPTESRSKIPGGIGAHGLSGFEPEPFGLATEVAVNFTIPGSFFLARQFSR
jgi:hypothetical protein